MQTDNIVVIPHTYAAYLNLETPEVFMHSRWSEACDLLLAHVRHLAHQSHFDLQKLIPDLDLLSVKLGLYEEIDAPKLLGSWMGSLDTAGHTPFVTAQFEPEDDQKLYVPFGYWLYRATKNSEKAMIVGWGEAADVLLSVIRLRAQAASKVHQGFEDLVTWLDDLALSKGAETVNPATAEAVRKSFGFDAVDMREALAIAA